MDAHQTTIYTAIIIASAIIGSILIFFIISLIWQQRRNARLYKSKILAEITTLENERQRVSADLHDEIGPLLSAIKLKLSSIEIKHAEDEVQMQESNKYLDDIIARMREISNDLMPSSLIIKGLITATAEFINKLPDSTGLKINFTHKDLPPLRKEQEINLYRIIQEIIHNTIKHAKASVLNIDLVADGSGLVLSTEDNGKGFDYIYASRENMGLGLRSLLSRTDVLNGKLYVDSHPGKGTTYSIQIPY